MSYLYGSLNVLLLDAERNEVARKPARFYATTESPGHVRFDAEPVVFSNVRGEVWFSHIEDPLGLCIPLKLDGGPYALTRQTTLTLGPLRFHGYAQDAARVPVEATAVQVGEGPR